jgi:hypothetical protein
VDEAQKAGVAALEGPADAAPELEAAAEPARERGVEVEAQQRPRALARAVLGADDPAPVEVATGRHAPRRTGHVERRGGGGEEHDSEESRVHPARVEPPGRPLYTPRMEQRALEKDLDRQIVATHRRFVKAMDGRLGSMSFETKERYFAVLSTLVTKLETGNKPMREVMQEMMSEAASVILQEMQG